MNVAVIERIPFFGAGRRIRREIEGRIEYRGRIAVRFVISLRGVKRLGAQLIAIDAEKTGVNVLEFQTKIDNVAKVQHEVGGLQF